MKWFSLLINLLIDMDETNESSKQDWILKVKKLYKNDEKRLRQIAEIENNYNSLQAVTLYTRDMFVYDLLNTMCRQRNIEWIVSFRFLIVDLYRQLRYEQQQQQESSTTIFYRGQLMSHDEVDFLQKETAFNHCNAIHY
ncbi:unnamed protein product [Didymodactylos carnosus]|uniref:Uncharacterized protein n=1 Tax=Didymodactylos carnosus TaxID=1234261 RepID=A0A815E143_9BILA|nr:unnamed protein product [Didymodactylos carnosus]CAF1300698.1 unnamed protein product [Didymodactylos carnosus]CAF3895740.1 unnamed protein product [Didymodactylos carnosus]CAF4123913.1 unnamed protein product [Didymodactylos carnosus]